MTDKTEALRLAERLELRDYYEFDASLHCPQAASLLRSQAERIGALEKALISITAIENQFSGSDWEEIEQAREIARTALEQKK